MKLETARRVVLEDPVLQISETGQDDDGGLRPLSYWVQRDVPEWPKPQGPPRIPRETEYSPWPTLVAGCLLGLGGIVWGVGFVTVVRWLTGG